MNETERLHDAVRKTRDGGSWIEDRVLKLSREYVIPSDCADLDKVLALARLGLAVKDALKKMPDQCVRILGYSIGDDCLTSDDADIANDAFRVLKTIVEVAKP